MHIRVVSFLLFVCVFLISACTNMFFQPLKQHITTPEQYGIVYEDIYFQHGSGPELHGWWFPASLKKESKAKANILFLHGNAENISTHSGLVYWLTQYGYNVFIFDYRGYGKSAGSVSIQGAQEDINSAREYVKSQTSTDSKFLIIAHSLGASLAVYSLANYPQGVDGIVLISPFSDYTKVAQEMMSRHWLTWLFQWVAPVTIDDNYNPIDYVSLMPEIPKLFVYSEQDQIIDPDHIKDLYRHSSSNRYIEKFSGRHNNVFSYTENQAVLLEYINKWSEPD